MSGIQILTLMVIVTDCTGSCKSNYHMITITTALFHVWKTDNILYIKKYDLQVTNLIYFVGTPDAMLNPKKKVWEAVKPDLRVNKNKVATYKGAALKIEGKGEITSPTLSDVQIQ